MAAEGASVLATDINSELLSRFAGLPNIQTALLDVMDKEAFLTPKLLRIINKRFHSSKTKYIY